MCVGVCEESTCALGGGEALVVGVFRSEDGRRAHRPRSTGRVHPVPEVCNIGTHGSIVSINKQLYMQVSPECTSKLRIMILTHPTHTGTSALQLHACCCMPIVPQAGGESSTA